MTILRTMLVALTLASAPAAAQAPFSPAGLSPVGPWTVDGQEGQCMLTRKYPAAHGQLIVGFMPLPKQTRMEILLLAAGADTSTVGIGKATLRLSPGGQAFPADYTSQPLPSDKRRRLIRMTLERAAFDLLPETATLTLDFGNQVAVVPLAMTSAAKAVAALDGCQETLLRHWGIDPAELSSAVKQAEPINIGSAFNYQSYPQTALNVSGRVVAAVTVGADGDTENCHVVVSAGNESLDLATCRIAVSKLRYRPAQDRDGKPIRSLNLLAVRWTTGS